MNHKMVCFVCDKNLGAAMTGDDCGPEIPPSGATVWYTGGNYGTTVFDPMNSNKRLEAYVCDECLKERAARVYTVVQHVKTEKTYLPGIVDDD
jgi:hypothetical protein